MEYRINCAGIESKQEFHRILAKTLAFPEWYGHNLDALYDCLTDISADTHLILENWDALPPALRGFRAVLEEAEADNLYLVVNFISPVDTYSSL